MNMRKIKHNSKTYQRKRHFKVSILKPRERLYNRVWNFHMYDEDPFPSVLHGHSREFVLDAYDGAVYSKQNKTLVGHAKKKELQSLQADSEFRGFAEKHFEWYREAFPKIPVEVPSWVCQNKNCAMTNNKREKTEFSCAIEIVIEVKRRCGTYQKKIYC